MRKVLLSLIVLAFTLPAFSQGVRDIVINEVLVKNIDNYEDDYGHRSSWIELHNTGHSKVNIGGSYLRITADGEEYSYRIPTGDPKTEISPLGYCVFFCEGTGTKGTFYTNFTLENVERIAFYDASGKEKGKIDELLIDFDAQRPDISIGRFLTENGSHIITYLPQTTPNSTNDTEPMVPKHEKFRQMDPYGIMLICIAIPVVIFVLILLFLFFLLLGKYMVRLSKRKAAASKPGTAKPEDPAERYESPFTGEEVAAIVMALNMYSEDMHDKESKLLTINKVARAYSPWSSKIYGLGQYPKK